MQKITLFTFFIFFSLISTGQSVATYDITFNSIWNTTDHTSVPGSAHWSKLVGATHKTPNTFLQIGSLASTGIKNVAEFGSNSVFNTEVNTQITNSEADQYINGPSLGTGAGDIVITDLEVDEAFPLLTLVSMIAPSPDWIIALNSYELLDSGGNWKTSVTVDVFAYDAGTDSGTDYTSGNVVTNPAQPISMIAHAPINGNKMGTITITLKSVLSTQNISPIEAISIYPNPTEGSIKISNPNNVQLKNIEVFNLLGKRVANRKASSNENYNFSHLDSGVYILKLVSNENAIKTQRLVIQ